MLLNASKLSSLQVSIQRMKKDSVGSVLRISLGLLACGLTLAQVGNSAWAQTPKRAVRPASPTARPFFNGASSVTAQGIGSQTSPGSTCDSRDSVILSFVGDLLLHEPLLRQGFSEPSGFRSLWRDVEESITGPEIDISYANLEGPIAPGVTRSGQLQQHFRQEYDGEVFSDFPLFNYPARLADDLKDSGFDIVSTSNNHSLDRRAIGADLTIRELDRVQLPFTGTRESTGATRPWHRVLTSKGLRIAFVGCAEMTNGIPNRRSQVLHCFSRGGDLSGELNRELQALRADSSIDLIVVTPHWGEEYEHSPRMHQILGARRMVDAGADLVVGAHPHVVQPWQKIISTDGREALVLYSLGNFVSGQGILERRASISLHVAVGRGRSGRGVVQAVSATPLAMRTRWERNVRGLSYVDAPQTPKAKHRDVGEVLESVFDRSGLRYPGQSVRASLGCR